MKNERAVCDRNSDLNGNLLVWITSKQLKLHQKHKMALIQYCLSATWRLSFLSHFWAEKSPSLMNGARFCIQICRNDGLILDLHCRQKNFHLRKCCIFPVFDPRNSLFGEIASYGQMILPTFIRLIWLYFCMLQMGCKCAANVLQICCSFIIQDVR